jgi:beta-galactosidase GanA
MTSRALRPNGMEGRMFRRMMVALCASSMIVAPAIADVPVLRKDGEATQLVVNGRPMLMIGGELGNSSASSAAYMQPIWPRLKAMHLNTVLAPVSWELIEPVEGRFDFSSVDQLIRDARAHDMKLVILWFGAWKNSMSTYVPGWVKRDQTRFPRAQTPNGQGVDILSAFAPETLEADQRAFAALMRHIARVDDGPNTVVMMQVENEIGMLPVARDHGPLAEAAWRQPVPAELVRHLVAHRERLVPEMQRMWVERGARTEGSWEELFGPGDAAAEVFTAWHYARFANELTRAGKATYPMPMYVNVALNRPGRAPGEYPSGGPLPHLIDVWKAGGPDIDLLAPDIYFSNFVDIVARYHRPDNPLLVPEAHNADNPVVPANAFYAFGQHAAIGFGPFSIESIAEEPGAFADAYSVLRQMEPHILRGQREGRIGGFKPRQRYDDSLDFEPQQRVIGDYGFRVAFADIQRPVATPQTAGFGGIIVQTGPEEYLVAGQGITVTFEPVGGDLPIAGIDQVWEGRFDDAGRWVPGRLLNGDQTHQGRHVRLPEGKWQIQKVRLFRYR